jgi:hypothetical protein
MLSRVSCIRRRIMGMGSSITVMARTRPRVQEVERASQGRTTFHQGRRCVEGGEGE